MTATATPLRIATGLLLLVAVGCSSDKEPARPKVPPPKPDPVIDTSADRASAQRGWALAVAKSSDPLLALAKHTGWQKYFVGDARAALDEFDAKSADIDVRIGRARAALDLALAHADLMKMQLELTPRQLAALATRPDAGDVAPYAAYVKARHAGATGQKVSVEKVPAAWAALLAEGAVEPGAALLKGEAAGVDAALPQGATEAYAERLKVAALVKAGRTEEALKRWQRIKPKTADFQLQSGETTVALRDPLGLRGAVWAYATTAKMAVEGLSGWPTLLRARAELLMGDPMAAATTAGALADAPPKDAPTFAQLVLTSAHDGAELAQYARALQSVALRSAGKEADAKTALDKLPADTISARVLRLWAGAKPAAESEFPRDRSVLTKLLLDAFDKMGDAAKGADDFSALGLADRYVDEVQRRYAHGLFAADKRALAVKTMEAAEDKSKGLEPSRRNLVTSMVATARMNMGISRPRVALKYLSRLDERLPAVAGPAEILRDLLSLQAMENAGGATVGQ